MIRNTFCHIPRIGIKTEQRLWDRGFLSWEDVEAKAGKVKVPGIGLPYLESRLRESTAMLEKGNAPFFQKGLKSSETWRLFPEFRESTAFLDIETTGLDGPSDHITTIAVYDGREVSHYVYGRNLEEFVDDIRGYDTIVTYNGKCFDVPFIENYFRIKMDQAHIDLRFVLKSLGYSGGLKGCEKKLGLDREDLDGVDGYFAVLLWHEFESAGSEKALETLLAYNVLDTVNLETLMVMAYNMKLQDTPFAATHEISMPTAPENPFEADKDTINRIIKTVYGGL